MKAWTKDQIDRQPWQTIPEQLEALGLTAEDGMEKVWFIDANGNLSSGAEAINRTMRYCWWTSPFTYLYFLPGIQQIQDWGYQWISDNRYRLPGGTPNCNINNSKSPTNRPK